MRVSPETIYRTLFVQARGALRKELTTCLRTGRAQRRPQMRSAQSGAGRLQDMILISERPGGVGDRGGAGDVAGRGGGGWGVAGRGGGRSHHGGGGRVGDGGRGGAREPLRHASPPASRTH